MSSSEHPFQPPTTDASRSPCPALNALANHGYLPHDGRGISTLAFVKALRDVYNISLPLSLVLALGGLVSCARPFHLTLDLHELAKHNRIEHDGSLTHDDAEGNRFAPIKVDKELVDALVKDAHDGKALDFDDLVRARVRRDSAIASHPLDSIHAEISRGEIALILKVLGDGATVPVERVRAWFGEERLPLEEGWAKPVNSVGINEVRDVSKRIVDAMSKAKKD